MRSHVSGGVVHVLRNFDLPYGSSDAPEPWRFRLGERMVTVSVGACRDPDQPPRFYVNWYPHRPAHMSRAEIEEFDRQKALALRALLFQLGF